MRDYLTLGDVLAIHADQIATYGGASGIRDPGQLDFDFAALDTWLRDNTAPRT